MATITRIISTAALLSALFVSEAGVAVSALSINDGSSNVRPFQRAAAHQEHARLARRGGKSKRCAAKTTTASPTTTKKADNPQSTSKSSSGGGSGSGSSSGGGGGSKPSIGAKKGLAWSNGMDSSLHYYVNSKVGTIYTWGATCPGEANDLGLKCGSMLWGNKNRDSFRSNRGKAPILMGMNEVNLDAQANLSPGAAHSLWMSEIHPYKDSKYLVSPSVTSAPDGVQWMKDFFGMCSDKFCGADAISLHYYGKSASELIDYVTNFRAAVGYPDVWISEFACQSFVGNDQVCTKDEVFSMMSGVVSWAESTSWVKMYAPYGILQDTGNVGSLNSLMKSNGQPTDLAYVFLNN